MSMRSLKTYGLLCKRHARKGSITIVKYLIEHGADPTIKDDRGRTALDIARKNNCGEIVAYLSQKSANKEKPDGKTG